MGLFPSMPANRSRGALRSNVLPTIRYPGGLSFFIQHLRGVPHPRRLVRTHLINTFRHEMREIPSENRVSAWEAYPLDTETSDERFAAGFHALQ